MVWMKYLHPTSVEQLKGSCHLLLLALPQGRGALDVDEQEGHRTGEECFLPRAWQWAIHFPPAHRPITAPNSSLHLLLPTVCSGLPQWRF